MKLTGTVRADSLRQLEEKADTVAKAFFGYIPHRVELGIAVAEEYDPISPLAGKYSAEFIASTTEQD